MRKKLAVLLIFSVTFLFVQNLFAQKSYKDLINIKDNVANNINKLKKTEIYKSKNNNFNHGVNFFNKNYLIKSFVFIEGSLLILITLSFNRRKKEKNRFRLLKLKENIKKLRAEKIGSVFNLDNYKLRKQLIAQPVNFSELEISRRAKQYSIAKGELQLAYKIKMMKNGK